MKFSAHDFRKRGNPPPPLLPINYDCSLTGHLRPDLRIKMNNSFFFAFQSQHMLGKLKEVKRAFHKFRTESVSKVIVFLKLLLHYTIVSFPITFGFPGLINASLPVCLLVCLSVRPSVCLSEMPL